MGPAAQQPLRSAPSSVRRQERADHCSACAILPRQRLHCCGEAYLRALLDQPTWISLVGEEDACPSKRMSDLAKLQAVHPGAVSDTRAGVASAFAGKTCGRDRARSP